MPEDFEDYKREKNFSHWGGRAAALEDAEAYAKQMAGGAFSAGKDERANMWREISIWLGKTACEERAKQKEFAAMPHGGV